MQPSTLFFLIIAVAGLFFYIWRLISRRSDSSRKPAPRSPIIVFGICLAASIALFADLHHFFPQMMEPAPTNTPLPTQAPSPTPTQPEELPPLIDYAEILRHSEEYDGQEVRVSGRIAKLGYDSNKYSFYFRDRLGFLGIGHSFEVALSRQFAHFSYDEGVSDYYCKNQYVVVQGIWNASTYSPRLQAAQVIITGEDAQKADQQFQDEWMAIGQSYSSLPITHFLDFSEAPGHYLGQRVRTVGQIHHIGHNAVAHDVYLSFNTPGQQFKKESFSLQGCPPEMQDACVEGEYIVLSFLVDKDDYERLWFSDCFVECIGSEAQALSQQADAEWWERFATARTTYINSCQEHDYDSLARYPDKNKGERIVITGIVIQTRLNNLDDDFLLDVGQGDLVSISYYGKLYDDPEILKGDQVTFYGECCGTDTYETAQNETNTVPWIIARYSSFNQFPS